MRALPMRWFAIKLSVLLIVSSCVVKMSNDRQPPGMKWYSFPLSGFQLKDVVDSLIETDSVLFYDPLRDNTIQSIGVIMTSGKDTVLYLLYISGDAREWLKRPDSSHLALMDIRPGHLFPAGFDGVISEDTLTAPEKKHYHDIFNTKFIDPLRNILLRSDRYMFRPLNTKDTLEAEWIICKGKLAPQCDTLWLTRKRAQWILGDSAMPASDGYRN